MSLISNSDSLYSNERFGLLRGLKGSLNILLADKVTASQTAALMQHIPASAYSIVQEEMCPKVALRLTLSLDTISSILSLVIVVMISFVVVQSVLSLLIMSWLMMMLLLLLIFMRMNQKVVRTYNSITV